MPTLTKTLAFTLLSLSLAIGLTYAQPEPNKVAITVKGLACPFCVHGLEKQLKQLDAVEDVSTSLKKGEAVLNLKPGRTVTKKELQQAVKKAGFTAGEIILEKQSVATTPDQSVNRKKK